MQEFRSFKSVACKAKFGNRVKNSIQKLDEPICLPSLRQKQNNELRALLVSSMSNLNSIESNKQASLSPSNVQHQIRDITKLINTANTYYTNLKQDKKQIEMRKELFNKKQQVSDKDELYLDKTLTRKIARLNIYRYISNLIILRSKEGSTFECCVTDEATKRTRYTELTQETFFNYIDSR